LVAGGETTVTLRHSSEQALRRGSEQALRHSSEQALQHSSEQALRHSSEQALYKHAGQGGRNTELALAAVLELAGLPSTLLITLATDGEDGPTDAAGAVVSSQTWQRAQALGLDPVEMLNRHDSYTFFAALDDLIKTGSTGTNVNDLVFLFGF
jgi:glycerate-2-kinase